MVFRGITRDRSAEFFEAARQAHADESRITQDEISITIDPVSASVGNVELDIQQIKNYMQELLEKHRELPSFTEDTSREQQIEILTKKITSLFQGAYNKIKKMGTGINQTLSQDEAKMRQNVQAKLANELQELSMKFKQDQRQYLQRLRGLESKAAMTDREFQLTEEEAPMLGNDEMAQQYDRGFDGTQFGILVEREKESESWEHEMKSILSSVQDLNTIFRDLNVLVIEQGTIVDRIDYHLQIAEENMDSGIGNMKYAEEAQKGSRSKMLILILAICILIALILVIIKFSLKAFTSSLVF